VATCANGEPPTAHGGTVPDGVSRHFNVQQTLDGSMLTGIVACDPNMRPPYPAYWQLDVTPGHFSLIFQNPPNSPTWEVDTFVKQ
jgi:hypothetical protein